MRFGRLQRLNDEPSLDAVSELLTKPLKIVFTKFLQPTSYSEGESSSYEPNQTIY